MKASFSLIISLDLGFSLGGTESSMSGTSKVALVVTHFRSMRSWLPGTYKPDAMNFESTGLGPDAPAENALTTNYVIPLLLVFVIIDSLIYLSNRAH